MQQILKFNIEIFDVRTRSSISIINDSNLVRSIQINKNISLDNIATIVFQKSKSYNLLPMEEILKLYNYVKMTLEVKNYNPSNLNEKGEGEILYFSGFIQTINKQANFGTTPSSAVSITVSDYANLLKTTFYTKNLTFLEILNTAVPEFRLINLTEYLGKPSKDLLSDFYTPTQLGFVFFTFLYFKFMYRILYDDDGSLKKTQSPDSRPIFKQFKLYMPFGFDIPIGDNFSGFSIDENMFKGQEQSLTIYKQLQGVALDLFKYIYPEPIFEFSTFETEDSVILQIRLTPFMKFDRPLTTPQPVSFGKGDFLGEFSEKQISTEQSTFLPQFYDVIEKFDFGFNRIKSILPKTGRAPASLLRDHLNEEGLENPKRLIKTLQEAIGESKHINIEDLIANDTESNLMTDKFFNVIPISTDYVENINMSRSAQSVVNIIWTVPTTDTSILKMSGREIVYAYLQQKLSEIGGRDSFANYLYQQFSVDDFYPNPVFLMDYQNIFGSNFVSGDLNYFGFREFEVKWNYLSIHYGTVGYILDFVDKKILEEARKTSKDTEVQRVLDIALRSKVNADTVTRLSTQKSNPREIEKIFEGYKLSAQQIPGFDSTGKKTTAADRWKQYQQTSRVAKIPKQYWTKNKASALDAARKDEILRKALDRYSKSAGLGKLDKKSVQNADTIIKLIKYGRDEDAKLMGGFVSKINRVVASAYRENEHLYDCNVLKPIDVSILPGMVVESTNKIVRAQSPRFKGYVTAISHIVDFNASTMKTNVNISRAASDDSGVIPIISPDYVD